MHQIRMNIKVTRNLPHRNTFFHYEINSISFELLSELTTFALRHKRLLSDYTTTRGVHQIGGGLPTSV